MYKKRGGRCQTIPADLAVEGVKACVKTTGVVDILVSVPKRGGGLFDINMDDWRESWG